jgi:hypothetical protein
VGERERERERERIPEKKLRCRMGNLRNLKIRVSK